MRIRLTIESAGRGPINIVWPVVFPPSYPKNGNFLVSDLLVQVNKVVPLEHTTNGSDVTLDMYAVELNGFECLHFQQLDQVFCDGDVVLIRPRTEAELRSGRIEDAGDALRVDGVRFGSPFRDIPDALVVQRRGTYRAASRQDYVPAAKRQRRSLRESSTVIPDEQESGASEAEKPRHRRRRSVHGEQHSSQLVAYDAEAAAVATSKKRKRKLSKRKRSRSPKPRRDATESFIEIYESLLNNPDPEEELPVDGPVLESDVEKEPARAASPADSSSDSSSSSSSSSSDSSSSSESDSSSDSASEPEELSSHRPSKPNTTAIPLSPAASASPRRATAPGTLPGQATIATQRRQERKKYSRKLKSLQNEGILGDDIGTGDLRRILIQWEADINTPNTVLRRFAEQDPEVITRVRLEQQYEKAAEDAEAATTQTQPQPTKSAKKAFRKAKANGFIPQDWDIYQFMAQRNQHVMKKAHLAKDAAYQEQEEMEEGLDGEEGNNTTAMHQEMAGRYDQPSDRLFSFGRGRDTDYDESRQEEVFEGFDEGYEDPDAWKSKITLEAVECELEGVSLPTPGFPFNQNQLQPKKSTRRKNKKQQQSQPSGGYNSTYDKAAEDEYYADADITLDYGDEPSAPPITNTAQPNSTKDADELEFALPHDPKSLPHLVPPVRLGTIIHFSILICDQTTNWQPTMSENRMAKIIGIEGDSSTNPILICTIPMRDRMTREYDPETGERIFGKFEMPEDDDEEDDGVRDWSFAELTDPRIVAAPGDIKGKDSGNADEAHKKKDEEDDEDSSDSDSDSDSDLSSDSSSDSGSDSSDDEGEEKSKPETKDQDATYREQDQPTGADSESSVFEPSTTNTPTRQHQIHSSADLSAINLNGLATPPYFKSTSFPAPSSAYQTSQEHEDGAESAMTDIQPGQDHIEQPAWSSSNTQKNDETSQSQEPTNDKQQELSAAQESTSPSDNDRYPSPEPYVPASSFVPDTPQKNSTTHDCEQLPPSTQPSPASPPSSPSLTPKAKPLKNPAVAPLANSYPSTPGYPRLPTIPPTPATGPLEPIISHAAVETASSNPALAPTNPTPTPPPATESSTAPKPRVQPATKSTATRASLPPSSTQYLPLPSSSQRSLKFPASSAPPNLGFESDSDSDSDSFPSLDKLIQQSQAIKNEPVSDDEEGGVVFNTAKTGLEGAVLPELEFSPMNLGGRGMSGAKSPSQRQILREMGANDAESTKDDADVDGEGEKMRKSGNTEPEKPRVGSRSAEKPARKNNSSQHPKHSTSRKSVGKGNSPRPSPPPPTNSQEQLVDSELRRLQESMLFHQDQQHPHHPTTPKSNATSPSATPETPAFSSVNHFSRRASSMHLPGKQHKVDLKRVSLESGQKRVRTTIGGMVEVKKLQAGKERVEKMEMKKVGGKEVQVIDLLDSD